MNTGIIGSCESLILGSTSAVEITEKFRVGAQIYDRNLGQLGRWHPSLDWGFADYRFKSWFGVRGGKVKTTLGLYTDTQDLDFLHTFALLPQSIYGRISAMPRLLTWVAMFTALSRFSAVWAIFPIRSTPDIEATASIAASRTLLLSTSSTTRAMAACSMGAISDGTLR